MGMSTESTIRVQETYPCSYGLTDGQVCEMYYVHSCRKSTTFPHNIKSLVNLETYYIVCVHVWMAGGGTVCSFYTNTLLKYSNLAIRHFCLGIIYYLKDLC